MFVYAALAVGLFAMFYPVLSGTPTTIQYAEKYLKWFDSWVLLQTW
jgi:dolichyl-phosphate-mannose--protein O-mannosyl transferase